MKEGKNRPSWFRGTVEGGKAGEEKPKKEALPEIEDSFVFKPVTEVPAASTEESRSSMEFLPDNEMFPDDQFKFAGDWQAVGKEPHDEGELAEMKKESALIHLFLDLSHNPPANFHANVSPGVVREHAPGLRSWSVASLHNYLSGPIVWQKPSFTEAVFQEIRQRMMHGGGRLLPRD